MKTSKLILLFAFVLAFTSCSDDDDAPVFQDIEADTVTNLHAPQTSDYTVNPPAISGDFVKFDFETGMETTDDDAWDIAFRGSAIIVNGGVSSGLTSEPTRTADAAAYIATGTLAEVTDVDVSLFTQDSATGFAIPTGSDNGWYHYDFMTHIISPIAGKILVFRTSEGRYAKVEILSYYQDMDTTGTSQTYTFNYVYNPNEGQTSFE